ncbi:cytochrome c oxidase assembly protein [Nocardia sp. NBC_01503]|uniref:cytochrome c oxidase assembly protein n=1 Tax=Nocardia sp. NBC_01503 TaxID=2975997 RepID=UPI002E7B4A4D|nr:cytochrome c oxidase assembly protein [Nocardia sp. NBC_01503]WTL36183.1 cytochrome c oxidase assembly protein [Nocardia sp. NBC_01503]
METPLTISSLVTSWRWDTSTVVITVLIGAGYALAWATAKRRGANLPGSGRAICFGVVGLALWLYTGVGALGVYSDTLFWVRALQTLLLLYLVSFGLAAGTPLTVLREALGDTGRARMDRILHSRIVTGLTFPLVPSAAILLTPWLLYFSPWYESVLRNGVIDAVTRIALVCIGFLYFYSRLQADPLPHRYSQAVSLLITVIESLADGILGIVVWLGPILAAGYYAEVGRTWGPSQRMDQTAGAGILWLLGDVLGIPFALMLMRAWSDDEKRKAAEVDAELDAAAARAEPAANRKDSTESAAESAQQAPQSTGLWWENDPQLSQRFRRR